MPVLKIAITVLSLAFATSKAPEFRQLGIGQATAPKPTSWRGTTGDLSVDMKFEQLRDSIYGRGSYKVGPKKRVGCGGETLPRSGRFTMSAKGNITSFRGKFLFDSGWMPPVSAKQASSGAVRVNINSIDRGLCVMTLQKTTKVGGSR